MEASNYEMLLVLGFVLVFGSSLIHYRAFAKSRAKSFVKKHHFKDF